MVEMACCVFCHFETDVTCLFLHYMKGHRGGQETRFLQVPWVGTRCRMVKYAASNFVFVALDERGLQG